MSTPLTYKVELHGVIGEALEPGKHPHPQDYCCVVCGVKPREHSPDEWRECAETLRALDGEA